MELIERSDSLNILQTRFDSVCNGEGHCIFIGGEAGIGKTSLLKVFCGLQQNDCEIYHGACDAMFTPRPLAPLYDIIWQVNKTLWPSTSTIEQRSELFVALFNDLKGRNRTSIVVFEDIHWADEATLDFIKFFARRISRLPCLFLLTYRDNELSFTSSLHNLYGQLSPDTFSRLKLSPLTIEAVSALASVKGYDGDDVYSISGGNPFYVNEILASYSPGVPENIKDSILAVYDRQEQGTKHAWQICSVIPEGLELDRFAEIKSSLDKELDHCFALNIIVVKKDRVVFKHELYRRTIEEALSPFKRIAYNKMMLDLFLTSFEDRRETERIVHYAKNAKENSLVVKYAPLAANQAASLGAHIESAKLYLSAIEYYQGKDKEFLLQIYEGYAYQCYLTNQIKEAIIYTKRCLDLWEEKEDIEKTSACLRFLSKLWWNDDNLKLANDFAMQAIEVVENFSFPKAKAMAYSNISQLKLFSDLPEACIFWGQKAIDIATVENDPETLSYAFNNIGSAKMRNPSSHDEGLASLEHSLDIALRFSYHEHAARAYTALAYNAIIIRNFALAQKTVRTGIIYCDENNLDRWQICLKSLDARVNLETGCWDRACDLAQDTIKNGRIGSFDRILALTTIATIGMRRGQTTGVISMLNESLNKAFVTMEPQRVTKAMVASLEYEWLSGNQIIPRESIEKTIRLIQQNGNIYDNGEVAYWLLKARNQPLTLTDIYAGFERGSATKANQAALLWKTAGCRYNEALAMMDADINNKKELITILQSLGATATVQKIKIEMRNQGVKGIPRGFRQSTLSNQALLTSRELEVLYLMKGGLQNKEIAAKLYIASKTVDHHISSILSKLGVNSRAKAVIQAVQQNIIK